MKLADYLSSTGKLPSALAADAKVPPSTITRLLKGERSPGIALLEKIKVATGGAVTPNDFVLSRENASVEPEKATAA